MNENNRNANSPETNSISKSDDLQADTNLNGQQNAAARGEGNERNEGMSSTEINRRIPTESSNAGATAGGGGNRAETDASASDT